MSYKSVFTSNNILLLLIIFTITYACTKYEEGPAISLRTKTNRITGTWEINEILKNGEIVNPPWFINLRCEINEDGSGEYKILVSSSLYEGNPLIYQTAFEWRFDNDKQYIKIIPTEENNKNLKGPEPDEPEDEDQDIDISFDANEIISTYYINIYARIIKLTNSDFWFEEQSIENEELVIKINKLTKIN
jgi:hypothetical protein